MSARAQIKALLARLSADDFDLRLDCETALGLTNARPFVVRAARKRVMAQPDQPAPPVPPPATTLPRVAARYAMIAGVRLAQAVRDLSEITGVPVSDRLTSQAWHSIYPGVKVTGRDMGICHSRSDSQRAAEWVFDQGCTMREAAQRFGVTRQAVHLEWRRLYDGTPTPSQFRTADRHAAIADMLESGQDAGAVAVAMGMKRGSVTTRAAKMGVSLTEGARQAQKAMRTALFAALDNGATLAEAARSAGISYNHASEVARESGKSPPIGNRSDRRDGRIARAIKHVLEDDASIAVACEIEECAPPSVYQALKRLRGDK